jgi:twitching motility protein PilT
MNFDKLINLVIDKNATDLFLRTGAPPRVRLNGLVKAVRADAVSAEEMEAVAQRIAGPQALQTLKKTGEADIAFDYEQKARFRAALFRTRGRLSVALRYLPLDIPSFEELNLPADTLRPLAQNEHGLVLVTGVAGSGKSTCLASMIEHINRNFYRHIVTIEDPIEYVFQDRNSFISQREVGTDTADFHAGLRHCVRQSPDVILIGEMRDRDTMEAALNAAETGHLVFSTLHTLNAIQTVERILSYFPVHQHALVRLQLSMALQGIVSLRLLRKADGSGLIPAVEIMLATPRIRELLEKGETKSLPEAIRQGHVLGCRTFNNSLAELLRADVISREDALASSPQPTELRLELEGLSGASSIALG